MTKNNKKRTLIWHVPWKKKMGNNALWQTCVIKLNCLHIMNLSIGSPVFY